MYVRKYILVNNIENQFKELLLFFNLIHLCASLHALVVSGDCYDIPRLRVDFEDILLQVIAASQLEEDWLSRGYKSENFVQRAPRTPGVAQSESNPRTKQFLKVQVIKAT